MRAYWPRAWKVDLWNCAIPHMARDMKFLLSRDKRLSEFIGIFKKLNGFIVFLWIFQSERSYLKKSFVTHDTRIRIGVALLLKKNMFWWKVWKFCAFSDSRESDENDLGMKFAQSFYITAMISFLTIVTTSLLSNFDWVVHIKSGKNQPGKILWDIFSCRSCRWARIFTPKEQSRIKLTF